MNTDYIDDAVGYVYDTVSKYVELYKIKDFIQKPLVNERKWNTAVKFYRGVYSFIIYQYEAEFYIDLSTLEVFWVFPTAIVQALLGYLIVKLMVWQLSHVG